MTKYKYQMHMHSFPCSLCSRASAREMAEFLKKGGFSGGVITNHFMHGNTGIDRKLQWEDFVKAYEQDYIEFTEIGKELDLDFMFGIEEGIGGGKEILVYGVSPKMLYDHPELNTNDLKTWYQTLKPYGVLILQAHPFRKRDYITAVGAVDEFIDGIEVYNACNDFKDNLEAEEIAKQHPEYVLVSGGDTHGEYACCWGGIETAARITSNEQLVDILRRGAYNLLKKEDEQ